jgi:hypothetical protein
MARFFVFLVVVGGTTFSMYTTKPTEADYLQKIETRSEAVASFDQNSFSQLRGGDPFDKMVSTGAPTELLDRTRVDDYFLVSVFTTEYQLPGYDVQQVRTYGLFSTLITMR